MIANFDARHWNVIAERLLLPLMDMTIKSTIFLVLAGLLTVALRRASAAQRHLVWTAALFATLVLPLFFAIAPRHVIHTIGGAAPVVTAHALVNDTSTSQLPLNESHFALGAVPPAAAKSGSTTSKANPTAVYRTTALSLDHGPIAAAGLHSIAEMSPLILCGVWLFGSVLMLTRMGLALRRLNALQRELTPLAGTTMQLITAQVLSGMKIHRPVRFCRAGEGSNITVPMTWGHLQPVVVLPYAAAAWPAERLRAALLHECAHVKRADWLLQILASIACSLYWFNPLIWVAARGMRHECERAADDSALDRGLRASDYAKHLLNIAQDAHNHRRPPQVMAMARGSKVEARLRAVLTRSQRRQQVTKKLQASALIAAALLLLSASWFRFSTSAAAISNPTQIASDATREVTPGATIKASGNLAILPNGFRISIAGLTQATKEGDQWNMYGGPWWSPDGMPISPQNTSQDGRWHWRTITSHNLAPHTFRIKIVAPEDAPRPTYSDGRYDFSVYTQLLGSYGPSQYYGTRTRGATITPMLGPLVDNSAPHRIESAVNSVETPAIFPAGTSGCVVRCGVAAGPWTTIAALPFSLTRKSVKSDQTQFPDYPCDVSLGLDARPRESYLDAHGKRHVVYFLGLGVLPNVARRFVAVDAKGEAIPARYCPATLSPGVGLSYDRNSKTAKANPAIDLSQIKELRLQTRPFQTVEFRDVHLQPTLPAGRASEVAAQMLGRHTDIEVASAMNLRYYLQDWARQNKALLIHMAHASANDFSSMILVYDSLQRLPMPLWRDDPRLSRDGEEPILQTRLPSRLTRTHLKLSRDSLETGMRADFARRRDFAVAQSFLGGRMHVTLWASGRVTCSAPRGRSAVGDKAVEGARQDIDGPFAEIKPSAAPTIDTSPLRFRRYVSKPLKDGARYTFLYPAYLQHVQEGELDRDNQFITVRIDAMGQRGVVTRPRGGVPVIRPGADTPELFPHEEYCCVVVGKTSAGYAGVRRERQWVGEYGAHHDLSLTDARTHMRFLLTHEDRYLPELFQQTDPIVMKSFRILPPGAAAN